MIPIPKFKELLGDEAKNMTDKEIEELRNAQYAWASLIFEDWAEKKGLKGKNTAKKRNT